MNIRAFMTALDVWDLDHAAKHALVVVCGRADRYTGAVRVPVARIAADMQVSYKTARQALNRLVAAGYLTVDKCPGRASTWRLTPVMSTYHPGNEYPTPRHSGSPTKESLDTNRKGGAAAAVVENGAAAARLAHALNPAAIAACRYCDEFGWLWRGDAIWGRCSHQRAVSDLTLESVLASEAL